MEEIDSSIKIKKSKIAIGHKKFYVIVKNKIVYAYIRERKYLLQDILANTIKYETHDLSVASRFIAYKKPKGIYIALPNPTFTYLNRPNVFIKSSLGNIIYFRDLNREKIVEYHNYLNKTSIPHSSIVIDKNVLSPNDISSNVFVAVKDDLSPNKEFYFISDSEMPIANTGAKPILTYGFSKNNVYNYFDVNVCSCFADIKEFLNNDLNYNKNNFSMTTARQSTPEFTCRLIQMNVFGPISFLDSDKAKVMSKESSEVFMKSINTYTNLRHELIPFLYSAFKRIRLDDRKVYTQEKNYIIVDNQILIAPIYTEVEKITNQKFIQIELDGVYYDFLSHERFSKNIVSRFYSISRMPILVKAGSIIPLVRKPDFVEYDIYIYPGASNEYVLHYDEYIQDNKVKYAYSILKLEYTKTKSTLTMIPNSIKSLLPQTITLKFVNVKNNCTFNVVGSEYDYNYSIETKTTNLIIKNTDKLIDITMENENGNEIKRNEEFLDKVLIKFFSFIDCNEKEKTIYKYKIRPYLHEPYSSIVSRIEKHVKFLNKKQLKKLYKVIEMYKK